MIVGIAVLTKSVDVRLKNGVVGIVNNLLFGNN